MKKMVPLRKVSKTLWTMICDAIKLLKNDAKNLKKYMEGSF